MYLQSNFQISLNISIFSDIYHFLGRNLSKCLSSSRFLLCVVYYLPPNILLLVTFSLVPTDQHFKIIMSPTLPVFINQHPAFTFSVNNFFVGFCMKGRSYDQKLSAHTMQIAPKFTQVSKECFLLASPLR